MRQPITIIILPPQTFTINGVTSLSNHRTFDAVDEFSAALSEAAGLAVSVVEGSLQDAPAEGFLIVYSTSGLDSAPNLGPRTVLLEAARGQLVAGHRDAMATDRYHLAAAVGDDRYFNWKRQRSFERSDGLYGLLSVAKRAGMKVGAFRTSASDYGPLSCPDHCRDLPSLLVHYLTVYEEMGLHLRRADS